MTAPQPSSAHFVPGSAPTSPLGSVVQYPSNWNLDPYEQNPQLKWPRSLAVYDQMLTDSQIISVLRAVQLPIMRTTWRIDPNGARDEVVEHVAGDLGLPIVGSDDITPAKGRIRNRFSWREHLRWSLMDLRYGSMHFEQQYAIDDQDKAHLFRLWPRSPRRISRINVDTNGELVSIEQFPAIGQNGIPNALGMITIESNRLVSYVNEADPGDWVGRSLLRAAYKNYLLKDELMRVQAATIRRNGMGIPVYTGGAVGEDLAPGWGIAQQVRAGETVGVAVPNNARFDLVGVSGTLPSADSAIAYHDQQMARSVLAHFLNLGTQTGSWALGASFQDFFTMSLEAVAQNHCDIGQGHIVEDIVDLNYGIDENTPLLMFDAIGSQQQLTAAALLALRQAGILLPDRELEQYVRELFHLPEKTAPSPGDPQYPSTNPTGDAPPVLPGTPGQPDPTAPTGATP